MDADKAREIARQGHTNRVMLEWRDTLMRSVLALGICAMLALGVFGILWISPAWRFAVGYGEIFSAVILALCLWRIRQRRRRASRATMLCPRCRSILREDGPDAWTSCDNTMRVCPECDYGVSDDVYAAAVLLTSRERAQRRASFSPKLIAFTLLPGFILVLTIALGNYFFASGPVHQSIALVMPLLPVITMPLVLPYSFFTAEGRCAGGVMAKDAVLRECDALLPEHAAEASLAICAKCGQRVSPPAALAEARRVSKG